MGSPTAAVLVEGYPVDSAAPEVRALERSGRSPGPAPTCTPQARLVLVDKPVAEVAFMGCGCRLLSCPAAVRSPGD